MMNKELLDRLQFQAAAQVNPLLQGREWQRVYMQKFVESIVHECACIADDMKSLDVAAAIKYHFGVE